MVKLEKLLVNPSESALIVVDVQNDFCLNVKGMAYHEREKLLRRDDTTIMRATIDDYLISFISVVRVAKARIVYTQAGYEEGQFAHHGFGVEYPELCIPGRKGWDLYNVSSDNGNGKEVVLHKSTHNPFDGSNGLEEFLKSNDIKTLLIAGFTTDNCIATTAYAAFNRGYKPVVVKDCVSTAGYKRETFHVQTLQKFEGHPGIVLVQSKDIIFAP